ncbi:hypothetical protein PR048_017192 [Dryococelus australis]|uniref:Uncharacterized protein n=1 Tax=Dryococelus australis TaxID=614101 RepID=A0ABQ9H8V1_9NEOP|nr:hypothetical protein PR048_017192 [Dryococelus australis]
MQVLEQLGRLIQRVSSAKSRGQPSQARRIKRQKQIGSPTSLERGKNITACMAMGVSGSYIPPMFIFPKVRKSPTLKNEGPEGVNFRLLLEWMDKRSSFPEITRTSCSICEAQ